MIELFSVSQQSNYASYCSKHKSCPAHNLCAGLIIYMIENYHFGRIVINGRTYTSDVIIFPDRDLADWWWGDGHSLSLNDIQGSTDAETGYPDHRHRKRWPDAGPIPGS